MLLVIAAVTVPIDDSIAADGQKAGVLELEVISGRTKHHKIASDITRTLRSVIRGQRRWRDVGKLSATLSDARDAFGCEPQNINCMKGLADTLGVNVLVWGLVDGTGPVERVQLWGVSTDGSQKHLNIPLPSASPHLNYRASAKKLLSAIMMSKERLTRVLINTEPKGAIIQVNRENVGLTPVVLSLREGIYDVEVSAEDYDLLEKNLVVTGTQTLELNWMLTPSSINAPLGQTEPSQVRSTVRWSALGIALTSLAATAYFSSEAILLTSQNIDRIECNIGTYTELTDCGPDGAIALISEDEYERNRREYQNNKTMFIGSLVITGIAASVFGTSFVF